MNLKQVLVTAAITCVFTVAAGVVTYLIVTKEPGLAFTVSGGPTLESPDGAVAIFVVAVRNPGRKEVENLKARIEIPEGLLNQATYSASPGVAVSEATGPKSYGLDVRTLNPSEEVTLSAMVTTPDPDVPPIISVRGKGIVAEQEAPGQRPERQQLVFLLAGALSALLGLTTSMFTLTNRFRRHLPGILAGVPRRALSSGRQIGPFDRNEDVALVLEIVGLREEAAAFRFAPSECSYRGAGDFLHGRATSAPPDEQRRFLSALKALLLIKNLTEDSRLIIERAVRGLSAAGDIEAQLEAIREASLYPDAAPIEFRDAVERIVAAP